VQLASDDIVQVNVPLRFGVKAKALPTTANTRTALTIILTFFIKKVLFKSKS
jgi:hypothetical protein